MDSNNNIELLTDVGKPLWLKGRNPRSIKGQGWWNKTRQNAYESADWNCQACGTHVDDVEFKKRNGNKGHLEAHEMYDTDWSAGVSEFNGGVVALCHACHSFIHADRLYRLYANGSIGSYRAKRIMSSRMDMLSDCGIKPNLRQAVVWLCVVKSMTPSKALVVAKGRGIPSFPMHEVPVEGWVMRMDGVDYPCLYRNRQEFEEKYLGESGWG